MIESQPELQGKYILAEAIHRVGPILGLTQQQLSTTLRAPGLDSLDPSSEAGRRAAKLILIYRRLYACVGGNGADLKHWMTTQNHYFSSRPIDVIEADDGLDQVLQYLNALRF